MTDMDVLKLKKAYGCDGNCGGWAKSETGGLHKENRYQQKKILTKLKLKTTGDLDGKSSDNESPCEWILETSPGKV